MNATPFFTADSELADLERHIRRLRGSAHAAPWIAASPRPIDVAA